MRIPPGAGALIALVLLAAAPARAQLEAPDPYDDAVRIPRIAGGTLVLVGEDHPTPDLADFPPRVEGSAAVEARWVEGSAKWIRAKDGLPLPRARLRISVRAAPEKTLLRWRGRAILLQESAEGAATEIYVPLLEGGEARIELDGKPAARVKIAVSAAPRAAVAQRRAVDHSCSPWSVSLRGLDDAYVSINCTIVPVGRIGVEEAMLEAHWSAAGVTLPDGTAPPFAVQLRDGRTARIKVLGPDRTPRLVELSANVPARLHRMRLAWGAGPYHLSSSAGSGNGYAGSAMLYGNFRLRTAEDGLSVRAFEAAVSQSPTNTAFFNNLGVYFAYDLKRVWDNRLHLTALLGLQSVTFAPRGLARRSYSTALFPQGFEVSYLDAFGRKNASLSGGLFLQPTADTPYQNFWIRYGKGWFGELNYISWRSHDRFARMSGISVGVPFAQLF